MYLRFTGSSIISCFHSVEIDTTDTQDRKKAEQNSSTRHFVSISLDFFNCLYGTDPEKIFLKRFITLSVSRMLAAIENSATNQKSYLILSVQHFVLFRNSLFANPLSNCLLQPCGYSKSIICLKTLTNQKVAKFQQVQFSVS